MSHTASCGNSVAYHLSMPLFKITSNLALPLTKLATPYLQDRCKQICLAILGVFVMLLAVIPATILWFASKAINLMTPVRVNLENLNIAPKNVLTPLVDDNIDISRLLVHYKEQGVEIPDRTKTKEDGYAGLKRLCDSIKEQSSFLLRDSGFYERDEWCQKISSFLRAIIAKLDDETTSDDDKKRYIKRIAAASLVCYPTWMQEAARVYKDFVLERSDPKEILLHEVQNYKEDLIQEYGQQDADLQWHTLNFMRNILGDELGLDKKAAEGDIYAGDDDPIFGKRLSKWIFLQRFKNADRLIRAIHTRLHEKATRSDEITENHSAMFGTTLVEIVKKHNINLEGAEDETDFVIFKLINIDGRTLTPRAVKLLLQHYGILTG